MSSVPGPCPSLRSPTQASIIHNEVFSSTAWNVIVFPTEKWGCGKMHFPNEFYKTSKCTPTDCAGRGWGPPHNWGQMINENHRAPAATQEPKGPRNSEGDAVRVKATSLQKMFIKIALINYEKNRWTAKSGTSFSGSLVSARSFFILFSLIFRLLLLLVRTMVIMNRTGAIIELSWGVIMCPQPQPWNRGPRKGMRSYERIFKDHRHRAHNRVDNKINAFARQVLMNWDRGATMWQMECVITLSLKWKSVCSIVSKLWRFRAIISEIDIL